MDKKTNKTAIEKKIGTEMYCSLKNCKKKKELHDFDIKI
jgi:hypothetical protein